MYQPNSVKTLLRMRQPTYSSDEDSSKKDDEERSAHQTQEVETRPVEVERKP